MYNLHQTKSPVKRLGNVDVDGPPVASTSNFPVRSAVRAESSFPTENERNIQRDTRTVIMERLVLRAAALSNHKIDTKAADVADAAYTEFTYLMESNGNTGSDWPTHGTRKSCTANHGK